MVKKIFCLTALLAALIASCYQSAWAQGKSYTQKPVYQSVQQYGHSPNAKGSSSKDPSPCLGSNKCLFYGGNFLDNVEFSPYLPNGLSNETDLIIPAIFPWPYGAATWVPFTVPSNVDGWTVTGLFTNNQSLFGTLDQYPSTPTQAAYYSVNSGTAAGYAGTVWASGIAAATSTATGRSAFGLNEYTIDVNLALQNLVFSIPPGAYWMAVVPICTNISDTNCMDRFFLSDTEEINLYPPGHLGPIEPVDAAFFDGFFGFYSFYPTYGSAGACGGIGCDAFSAGVQGVTF
jgi:hypothetical protein